MIYFVIGDMFKMQGLCSMAHCISSDGKMSQGLAKEFVRRFPVLVSLRRMILKIGTAVPVCETGRFLYNLITKQRYFNKPSVGSLESSLRSMRVHAEQFGVKTINVPMLGAGLDGLDFYGYVLPVIKEVFQESTVSIYIHFLRMEAVNLFRYVLTIEER